MPLMGIATEHRAVRSLNSPAELERQASQLIDENRASSNFIAVVTYLYTSLGTRRIENLIPVPALRTR